MSSVQLISQHFWTRTRLDRLSRSYTMHFFLQLFWQCQKKKSISSCRRHVTRSNLELQLAMLSKKSTELRSTLCNHCKPKKVRKEVERGHATCLATPLQHKFQRTLHHVTLTVELGCAFCNDCRDYFEILASVTCLLQLAMGFFFQRYETKCKKNCIVEH